MAKVLVMRRGISDLKQEEVDAIRAALGGKPIDFITIFSPNHIEHAVICRAHRPDLILLPLETPIPTTAMAEGFRHVTMIDGRLHRLKEIKAVFEPYEA